MLKQKLPPTWNVRSAKKFFYSSINGIFSEGIAKQSQYSAGDIAGTIRNAISSRLYIETIVRNSTSVKTPSADTIFRRIENIAYEPGSHKRKGSNNSKKKNQSGIEHITVINDQIISMAISMGAFSSPVDVAIDEHDEPYYGIDNKHLINAPFHKFRGTDKAYRFATLDSVKNGERFTLAVMKRDLLDGVDNASEVEQLLKHTLSLGIKINMVLMDRGYLDTGVMKTVESMCLKFIVPAKDNPKVIRFKNMEMICTDNGFS